MSNEELTVNTDMWSKEGHNDPLIIRTTKTEQLVQIESNTTVTYPSNKQLLHPKEYCLKYHIYEKVRRLQIKDDKVLLASYGEAQESDKKYDLENKLFYNIGTGAFTSIFKDFPKQVAFKKTNYNPNDKESPYRYLYKYEIISEKAEDIKVDDTKKIAEWTDVPINDTLPDKPDRYYAAIRNHASKITKGPSFPDQKKNYPFGIKIELTVPDSNKTSHPVSVMKRLLDGVICAFHGEKPGLAEQFQDKIINAGDSWNILGPREYLRKHGNGVQWNPEDNRLKFGWIIVKREGTEYKMNGSIYAWMITSR